MPSSRASSGTGMVKSSRWIGRPCKNAADTSPFSSVSPREAQAWRKACRDSRVAVGLDVSWL
eukprot:4611305-Alexandrium_andersonii.AAC.1